MKIEMSNSRYYRLSNIAEGDTFYYKNELYIKTDEVNESKDIVTIVKLSNGAIGHLFNDDFIIPQNAKIVVE